MKRPIKFRGRDIDGKFHYGDLIHLKGKLVIFNDKESVTVDSIAQLVGYDKDGREVYEGDIVTGEYGDEVVARLMNNLPPKPKLEEVSNEPTD